MSETSDYKPSSPFGLADFFIYLFPGFFFAFGCFVYFGLPVLTFEQIKQAMDWLGNTAFASSVTLIVVGLGIVYMIGHIIATISHVLVDRFTVECVIGYPYRHLLSIPDRRRDIVQPINSIILGSAFIVLFFSGFHAILPSSLIGDVLGGLRYPFCALLVMAVGMKFSFATIKVIQNAILSRYPSLSGELLQRLRTSRWLGMSFFFIRNFLKTLLSMVNVALQIPVKLLMQFLHLDRPLSQNVREAVLKAHGIDPRTVKPHSDLFWVPCYRSLQNPVFNRMINNWMHMYSLNRNMFVTFFVLAILAESNHAFRFAAVPGWDGWFIVANLLLAGICFIRYLILYYGYYSQSVYRMMVALPDLKIEAPQGEPSA